MEKIVVLGTGNALALDCYNTCFLIKKEQERKYLLVDAGGGNQILKLLRDKNIELFQINDIFVSDSHTEHIFGVIWLIRIITDNILKGKYNDNLNIYCHAELAEKIKEVSYLTLPKKCTSLFMDRINFVIVEDGQEKEIMNEKIVFFDVHSEKEKQFAFKILQKNEENITFLGEGTFNPMCEKYVENTHFLISEAFCMYKDRDIYRPYENHHSTARDAAEIANKFEVQNLILLNTETDDLENRKRKYTEEAEEYFNGNVYVPDDLEEIVLKEEIDF